MKRTFTKLLSVILTLTMLAGMTVVAGAEDAATLAVSSIAEGCNIPAGMKVPVVADAVPEAAKTVEVIYNSITQSADVAEGKATVYVEVANGVNEAVINAKDADDNIVASGSVELNGCGETVISTKFDSVDFEDGYTVDSTNIPSIAILKDGKAVGMGLHTGNENNAISIAVNPENDKYGNSLCLTTNDATALTQANNLIAEFDKGTVVYGYDFCAADFNVHRSVISAAVYPAGSTSYAWTAALGLNTEGYFVIGDTRKKAEINTWYNIKRIVDLDNDVAYTYIDDELFYVEYTTFDMASTFKLNFDINKTPTYEGDPIVSYADNIVAYNAIIAPAGVSLSNTSMNEKLSAGMVSKVNGIISGYTADKAEIYMGTELYAIIDSFDHGTFEFDVVLPVGVHELTAKIYKDNEFLAESETIKIKGYYDSVLTNIWNVDFETQKLTAGLKVTDADGVALNSNGGTLTANAGSSENSISIENRADGKGRAIKLVANDDAQVQFNEFKTKATDEMVKIQWDVMFEKVAETFISGSAIKLMQPVLTNGSNVWGEALYLKRSGDNLIITASSTSSVYPVTLGEWFTITAYTNKANGTINFYINGSHFATCPFTKEGVTGNEKVVFSIYKAPQTIAWVDNFVAHGVEIVDPVPTVNVRSEYINKYIVSGLAVPVNVQGLFMDDMTAVRIVDANTKEVVETVNTDDNATINIVVKEGTSEYVAQALDASGNVILTSETFKVMGYHTKIIDDIWDEDFENGAAMSASNGSVTVVRNGANVSSGGRVLTANAAGDSTVAVGSSEAITNKNNGNSFIATNNTSGTAQFNDIKLNASANTLVIDIDFATSTKGSKQVLGIRHSAGWKLPTINTDANGNFTFSGNAIGKYDVNTWYNLKAFLNVETGEYKAYIDGEPVVNVQSADYIGNVERLAISNNSVMNSSLYVDNIRAYTANFEEPVPGVLVDTDALDYILPAGTKATVKATANFVSGMTEMKLVRVSDGLVIDAVSTNLLANLTVEVKEWPVAYKVVALDANGDAIVESEEFVVQATEGAKNSIWDEDFTGVEAVANGVTVSFKRDDVALTSGSNALQANTGNAGNVIEIADSSEVAGKDNGDAIKLTTLVERTNVQLNSFGAAVTSGIAVASMDIAVSNLGARQLMAYVHNNGWKLPAIYGTAAGEITFDGAVIGKYEANKWVNLMYVVDTEEGICDIFVDNAHAYRKTGIDTSGTPFRVSVASNQVMGTMWADNFVVYQITDGAAVYENALAEVEYVADGAYAQGNKDENVKVSVVVTNDGNENTVKISVAVYEGNKLVGIKLDSKTFAADEGVYQKIFDLGNVTAAQNIKTMLWTDLAPVCQPVELN